ncbi:MAG: 4Fe-4S binding protein [Planctomycetes bacterium]|nr:4Fe-4S binding protein [Planctomycetota bacterium]
MKLISLFSSLRFYIALISTSLLNLRVFGVSLRSICTPGFNCHACPWATFTCPIGVMTYGFSIRTLPILGLAMLLSFGVLLGRLACGFLCPFGILQDLLHRIPFLKGKLPKSFRYIKYLALLILVIVSPYLLGYEVAAERNFYYCKVCPVGTLTAHVPNYFIDSPEASALYGLAGENTVRLTILGLFLVMMLVFSRPFCQTFCPLGAVYGLLSRLAPIRLRIDRNACNNCGLCDPVCPVNLDVRKEVGGAECIACGDCIKTCPQGAIKRKFGL